ncbi:MAG: hypothetical protein P0Y49_07035 [Candidatus Pedobacter colombiensis]|uniref:Uncharacterized protein n=1 Tax=Candidatus Pedobacter colombiensis TaxID=3121371 RepID=A0AAJ5WAF6_9SPHI|nr:hypothetical protein [Pedobacter sp.]WEK20889.1 MAG: hypothetical protein P0Y49_07035 [Pedobacter sp.]
MAMLFTSCNLKSNVDNIQIQKIVVKVGVSYKIDLEKETYTVYFRDGSFYEAKFTLSNKDKSDISKISKECGLNKLKGNINVEDNCQISPKVYTELSFYAGSNNVLVSIDAACDNHPFFKQGEPQRILRFLKFLNEKIFSKPEVSKAPKTDIRYM